MELYYCAILVLNLLLGAVGAYFVVTALWGLKRPRPIGHFSPRYRFAVLIAARNEEKVIGPLVKSLLAQNYPRALFDVFVIPNNCTDDTAGAARAAGAEIIEPMAPVRYKGDALRQAADRLLAGGEYDAFCVFDADNLADPDFLAEMNNAFCSGAMVARGRNRSKNPTSSWVSACYTIYFDMFNLFFSRARENCGLSANLIGTGFGVRASFLRELGGFRTETITEDVEFFAQCAAAGERVWWVPRAVTYDEEPDSFRLSMTQRRRWCSGSMEVAARYLPRLGERLALRPRWRELDVILFFLAPFVQALAVLPLGMTLLLAVLPGGPGLLPLLAGAAAWLVLSYGAATVLALLVCRRCGCMERGMAKGIAAFGLFMASWLPLQVASLFRPATSWREIGHGRPVAVGKAA